MADTISERLPRYYGNGYGSGYRFVSILMLTYCTFHSLRFTRGQLLNGTIRTTCLPTYATLIWLSAIRYPSCIFSFIGNLSPMLPLVETCLSCCYSYAVILNSTQALEPNSVINSRVRIM